MQFQATFSFSFRRAASIASDSSLPPGSNGMAFAYSNLALKSRAFHGTVGGAKDGTGRRVLRPDAAGVPFRMNFIDWARCVEADSPPQKSTACPFLWLRPSRHEPQGCGPQLGLGPIGTLTGRPAGTR